MDGGTTPGESDPGQALHFKIINRPQEFRLLGKHRRKRLVLTPLTSGRNERRNGQNSGAGARLRVGVRRGKDESFPFPPLPQPEEPALPIKVITQWFL